MPKVVDHEQRKSMIAQGAINAINKAGGIHKVTMTDIAKASNCTTGMVNHYFNDKDHVLNEAQTVVIEKTYLRLVETIEKNPTDLKQVILDVLPLDKERHIEFTVWREFFHGAGHSALLARTQKRWVQGWTEMLISTCQKGCETGIWRKEMDIEREMDLLAFFIDGLALRASLAPKEWPAERQEEYVDDYLRKLAD